jgi:2-oxoisovalerate dehydrogenase E2 component (dihydrolipoyl transacylase)
LRYVKGSQKNGRIIKDDVHNYLEGKVHEEATGKKPSRVNYETLQGSAPEKLSPTELVSHTKVESLTIPHDRSFPGMTARSMTPNEIGMVKAMTYNTTVPQFYSMEEVLIGKLISWRAELNVGREGEDRLSIMPFFIKAYSMALKYYPRINSLYYPERPYEFEEHGSHNISVAIDSKFGLIAPNIKDVAYKSLIEIDQDLKRLRKLADSGTMGSADLFGGTSAITNIGNYFLGC